MDKTPIIQTKAGKIQGYIENGIQIFKGIPFAEPPVEDLRFKPPIMKTSWEEVFDATQEGPYAFQGYSPLQEMFPQEIIESEDCLTLNVWTPANDEKKRPVMVWIHGGAYITGSGTTPIYNGIHLASRGDVVVVTINYRLGAFGFLYIPEVTANAGMLDQIAALEWVHENIVAFGGNPDNVTIFGESAGGSSVVSLLAMPAAKGLFNRAIAQSAPILQPIPTKKSTNDLMKKLGLEANDIDGLRKIKAKKIIEAQNQTLAEAQEARESEIMGFRPSIDGFSIPIHPLEAIQNGEAKDIDLLIGCNQDEGLLYTAFDPNLKNIDAGRLEKTIATFTKTFDLGDKSQEIIKAYEAARKDVLSVSPFDILTAIWTDYIFRISDIHVAETQRKYQPNTYFYIFTWPSPMVKGACHAVELPYVFGTLDIPGMGIFFDQGPDAELISQKMMDAWIAFARTGNPNHKEIPDWPSYDVEHRATMMIGNPFEVVKRPFEKEREVWEGLLKY